MNQQFQDKIINLVKKGETSETVILGDLHGDLSSLKTFLKRNQL